MKTINFILFFIGFTSALVLAQTGAPPTEILETSPAQLSNEYQANEARADFIFKKKRVSIEGIIESISKDILDNVVIKIKPNLRCVINKEQTTETFDLNKGDAIRLHGICSGLTLGDIYLKDCHFEKINPDDIQDLIPRIFNKDDAITIFLSLLNQPYHLSDDQKARMAEVRKTGEQRIQQTGVKDYQTRIKIRGETLLKMTNILTPKQQKIIFMIFYMIIEDYDGYAQGAKSILSDLEQKAFNDEAQSPEKQNLVRKGCDLFKSYPIISYTEVVPLSTSNERPKSELRRMYEPKTSWEAIERQLRQSQTNDYQSRIGILQASILSILNSAPEWKRPSIATTTEMLVYDLTNYIENPDNSITQLIISNLRLTNKKSPPPDRDSKDK